MAYRLLKLAFAAALVAVAGTASAKTLRVAPHSDLKIVDPVWTTALISTHHGMMIYDTLFALDRDLQVHVHLENHVLFPKAVELESALEHSTRGLKCAQSE